MTPEHRDVMELRIANLESSTGEIKQAVKSIDSSLQTLARLEQHHADTRDHVSRAFTDLTDHEARLRVIEKTDIADHEVRLRLVEKDMPTMRLARNWLIGGVIGVVSIVGMAALKITMGIDI